MRITNVTVRKIFEEGPLKAVVSVTFDDCIAVHDIKIVSVKDKTFVVMPSTKNASGIYRDIVHPIKSEMRKTLTDAVLEAYEVYIAANV